jgi:streptogramin lyase
MRKYLFSPFVVLVTFVAFLIPLALHAQSDTSSIAGTVTDATGAVLPNAKVTIHNNATGNDRIITTNQGGTYTLTNLPSGTYIIKVEAQGFETATRSNLHLDPNIGSRVDLAMTVGNTSAVVNVDSDANTIQTESGTTRIWTHRIPTLQVEPSAR